VRITNGPSTHKCDRACHALCVSASGDQLELRKTKSEANAVLTSRLRIIAANVGQRADNGQLSSAVLFVLLVEMAMASEKGLANLCDSIVSKLVNLMSLRVADGISVVIYPLFGVERKVTGIGHHVDGEISYLDECLGICIQQDGSVEQETAEFKERMER